MIGMVTCEIGLKLKNGIPLEEEELWFGKLPIRCKHCPIVECDYFQGIQAAREPVEPELALGA